MATVKPNRSRDCEREAQLDLWWANGMRCARNEAELVDFHITTRMIRANHNLHGLKHLQPLRGFLEAVAKGG